MYKVKKGFISTPLFGEEQPTKAALSYYITSCYTKTIVYIKGEFSHIPISS